MPLLYTAGVTLSTEADPTDMTNLIAPLLQYGVLGLLVVFIVLGVLVPKYVMTALTAESAEDGEDGIELPDGSFDGILGPGLLERVRRPERLLPRLR